MAKIMLVEDDNNLREIYEARLLAEGYEIVSAKDGEEALALAVKEKPDLIISDVMMPKISGFDMLDILRTTPETKNTRVIMMTALSQAEDKARADKLGADRYLVKSQVTLEDVAKVARDVLSGEEAPVAPTPDPVQAVPQAAPSPTPAPAAAPQPAAPVAAAPIVVAVPAPDPLPTPQADPDPVQAVPQAAPSPTPAPAAAPQPAAPTVDPGLTQTSADESASVEAQINEILAQPPVEDTAGQAPATPESSPVAEPTPQQQPTAAFEPKVEQIEVVTPPQADAGSKAAQLADAVNGILQTPPASPATPAPVTPSPTSPDASNGKKVITPINDLTSGPNLNELLAKEEAAEASQQVGGVVAPQPQQKSDDPNNIAL